MITEKTSASRHSEFANVGDNFQYELEFFSRALLNNSEKLIGEDRGDVVNEDEESEIRAGSSASSVEAATKQRDLIRKEK